MGKLGHERTHHGRVVPCHVRGHENEALRIFLGHVRHPIRPRGGTVTLDARDGDPCGDTPEILDKCEAQHDGDGPQFA